MWFVLKYFTISDLISFFFIAFQEWANGVKMINASWFVLGSGTYTVRLWCASLVLNQGN